MKLLLEFLFFATPKPGERFNISLPKELFEKMLGTNERLLLSLVTSEANVSFDSPIGATTDPSLIIESADVEEPKIPGNLILGDISLKEISNSQINITVAQNGDNNYTSEKSKDDWLKWFMENLFLPVLVGLLVAIILFLLKKYFLGQ